MLRLFRLGQIQNPKPQHYSQFQTGSKSDRLLRPPEGTHRVPLQILTPEVRQLASEVSLLTGTKNLFHQNLGNPDDFSIALILNTGVSLRPSPFPEKFILRPAV